MLTAVVVVVLVVLVVVVVRCCRLPELLTSALGRCVGVTRGTLQPLVASYAASASTCAVCSRQAMVVIGLVMW